MSNLTLLRHPALAALHAQAAAWNRGDLDGYIALTHPDIIYLSGGSVVHGREALAARFRDRFPSPGSMGSLSVTVLDATLEAAQVSAVLAWELDAARGHALVVFVPTEDGWKLRYDATLA